MMRFRLTPMDSPTRRKLEAIMAALPEAAVEDQGWNTVLGPMTARELDVLLAKHEIGDLVEAEPVVG